MATPVMMEKLIQGSSLKAASKRLKQITSLKGAKKGSGLVDTPAALSKVLDSLEGLPTTPPSLYIDMEGRRLSRHGSVSILQLHVLPTSRTYLLDVKGMGRKTFSTPGTCGRTLKEVLESPHIPKVFFDIRNDSDALYSHYNIKLGGVQDLQLMQLATQPKGRVRSIRGLGKCIERDTKLTRTDKISWKAIKEKGAKLFDPRRGGSYKVFDERPLRKIIQMYCVQDAKYLPQLWSLYDSKLTPAWKARVHEASEARVTRSQAPNFKSKGPDTPVGWVNL